MDDAIPRRMDTRTGTIAVKRVGVFLGAEVTGIDLTRPLDESTVAAISAAHVEHGVLVFPDQKISSEDLMRFGRHFGELSVHPFSTGAEETPELIVYDNKEGNPPAPTDIWHTDETFREAPPMGTILCSKIIPERGGDTNFCSMTAVWEGLSDRMQSFLSRLEAIHDFKPFKGLFDDTPEGRAKLHEYEEIYRPVTHPVVSVHPVSGRKVLYVNPQFVIRIKGMDEEESDAILDMLYRKILRHEYHYRHHWRPDMVVFWDNRQALHSALHDYYPQRRLMERVTIAARGLGMPARRPIPTACGVI
jgi:taurine dioxygenase